MTLSFLLTLLICLPPLVFCSTPPVVCTFHPLDSVRHFDGNVSTFNLTCINKQWSSKTQDNVLVVLDPTASSNLNLCWSKSHCNIHHQIPAPVGLNMTVERATFNFSVKGDGVGIRCLRQTAYFQRGENLFHSGTSVKSLELLHNMTGRFRETQEAEIPNEYTEVFVIEREKIEDRKKSEVKHARERMSTGEEVLLVDLQDKAINIALEKVKKEGSSLYTQYAVYTKAELNEYEEKGKQFSKILTLLALATANLMIGTGIDYQVLQGLFRDTLSSLRQMNCVAGIVSIRAWKVGLFCQLCYLPAISFALGKLVFRDGVQCSSVVDLSRLGLFLLGTAPGNTAAAYFSTLWNGDLQLSVVLVILSTVLSPASTLLWWATLGKVLLNTSSSDIPQVPILFIIEFISAMVIPVGIGIALAAKFPTLRQFMEKIRKPFFIVGMLGCIVIYYFQYQNFLDIFSLHHALACGSLALGSAFMAGLTAFFCRLQREQIISIVIDSCLQNGTLSYAVIKGSLGNPEDLYASSPANAQILFTSAPIMLAWFVYVGTKMGLAYFRKWRVGPGRAWTEPYIVIVPSTAGEVGEEPRLKMLRVRDIKEAWNGQHDLSPLWC